MMIKKWIILDIAVAAILVYVVGIPPSINAEYSKSRQHHTSQTNECGNGEITDSQPKYLTSDYESLADNVFCFNTGSQVQGEENSVGIASTQH